ncbi:sugar transferase [Sphingomonas sp.]|uniref:sugar transferase n=1 Tax=Sphingomonas sp. TaxID=28214 RepID=UPI0017D48E71|nr:sugar transferase [Sphingomonas sp.]MBA3510988.1 sugar transferase [Sphingomonas sp.]
MRHEPATRLMKQPLFTRRRFQFASALVIGALLPFAVRGTVLPGLFAEPAGINALIGNSVAIAIAFWMRLSIETYPGIRSAYVILPTSLTGHGVIVVALLLTRLPYDRLALGLGFALHVLWLYVLYFYAQRTIQQRIAIVPFGEVSRLNQIGNIEWQTLARPRLEDTAGCHAIVADFATDLPDEWEAFLADAALAGRIVYQVKQLSESLTGRVQLDHLSENSFGSLLPARGYFHLKALGDFLVAVAMLPLALPLMAVAALAIRAEGPGPILFRQARIGHAGRRMTVYKFRTMRAVSAGDERRAAMTGKDDERITRVGAFLRRTRIDELPQIFNILKWQMSWIGPRPEAEVLSIWYTSELPFYRYRHVVKPGISGWAQVNQGHVAEVEEVHHKLQYDFYYIKYFSPWLDLLIVFRTIKTVLTGFGSR